MSKMRKCTVCQSEYKYCPDCQGEAYPAWMFLFDTENCNNLWEVFNAYRTHAMNADEALKALGELDLSKEESFDPVWKDLLKQMRAEAKPKPVEEKKNDEKPKFNNFRKK